MIYVVQRAVNTAIVAPKVAFLVEGRFRRRSILIPKIPVSSDIALEP